MSNSGNFIMTGHNFSSTFSVPPKDMPEDANNTKYNTAVRKIDKIKIRDKVRVYDNLGITCIQDI